MVRVVAILVVLVALVLGAVVFTAPGAREPLVMDASAVRAAAEAQAASPAARRALAAATEHTTPETAGEGGEDDGGFLPDLGTAGPVPPPPQRLPPLDPAEAERLRQETAERVAAEARRQADAAVEAKDTDMQEDPAEAVDAVEALPAEAPAGE